MYADCRLQDGEIYTSASASVRVLLATISTIPTGERHGFKSVLDCINLSVHRLTVLADPLIP